MRAWESFVTDGEDEAQPDPHVRPLIQQSWHRCAVSAIDATSRRGAAGQERGRRSSSCATLAASCAMPRGESFARVGRLLEGAQAMLILTDHEGVIVETTGDPQTLEDGRRIHLEVGGVWNERVVGTNGIGTALWTGEPVFVHAAEHFCAGIKPLELRRRADPRSVRQPRRRRGRPVGPDRHFPAPQHRAGGPGRARDRGRHGAAPERGAHAPARSVLGLAAEHRPRGRRDPARSAGPRDLQPAARPERAQIGGIEREIAPGHAAARAVGADERQPS